jgi:hypothetical protein
MRISSGALLVGTGLLHELVGAVASRGELAALWKGGLFDSVSSANPVRMAVLWFLVAGLGLVILGAALREREAMSSLPLPRSMGLWLLVLGLLVVVPMPRSGGWLVFVPALLILVRAGGYRPPVVTAALRSVLPGAHHIDVRTVETRLSVPAFTAGMLAYQPGWISALYRVRWLFVRVLGMKQEGVPRPPTFSAATLPSQPGARAGFFTVRMAQDGVWAADAEEKHLRAMLAVVADPGDHGLRQVHVVTVVHYKHWTGPVYFNVIRPFHHLVVGAMMRFAVRASWPVG